MSNFFIVLAAVLGAGGPLMWFLTLFDKRNTDQHRNNMDLLKNIQSDVHSIQKDVKVVDTRLSNHIDWHQHRKD